MKKLIFLTVIFASLCSFSGFSQTGNQIVLNKKRYYQGEKMLNSQDLKTILNGDSESAIAYKEAKTNTAIGATFIGLGTVAVIYAIAKPPKEDEGSLPGLISDEEMNKWLVPIYISGGCIIASLPFLISGKKQIKKSISIYNKNQTTGFHDIQKLEFGLTQNGVGVVYRF